MMILTKQERHKLRYIAEDATCSWWHIREEAKAKMRCPYSAMLRALDTIDAMEGQLTEIRRISIAALEEDNEDNKGMDALDAARRLVVEYRGECAASDMKDEHYERLKRRAEATEATQDLVAMMLNKAMESYADGEDLSGMVMTWVSRAAQHCPSVAEARDRARKAAEALNALMHPNGRCTCCGEGACDWCRSTCPGCGASPSLCLCSGGGQP